jgi:hypothetical protein
MSARLNVRLYVPYLVCSLEGVLHGVYLVWLTQEKGLAPLTVALILAGGEVALFALEVPTGVFADRVGARTSLVLGSLVQALGLGLLWHGRGVVGLGAASVLIAAGDAFRHGADEALLYRSCAALGDAGRFDRLVARAHAVHLAALVVLTAGGGWLVAHAGFDVGFAVEIALSLVGLALAIAMTDVRRAATGADDGGREGDAEGREPHPLAALHAGLPWSRIAPAAIVGALATAGEFLAQSESRGRLSPAELGLLIAGAQLLEAAGAALVAGGLVAAGARTLYGVTAIALAALALAALWRPALLPALILIFVGAGVAPAIRSAILQREAPDHARATVASAAGAIDLLCTAAFLPLAAVVRRRRRS